MSVDLTPIEFRNAFTTTAYIALTPLFGVARIVANLAPTLFYSISGIVTCNSQKLKKAISYCPSIGKGISELFPIIPGIYYYRKFKQELAVKNAIVTIEPVKQEFFPADLFNCYFENNATSLLVVSPKKEINLIEWAEYNRKEIHAAFREFKGIVFHGFNLSKEQFSAAFKAITRKDPQTYKGDSPRTEVQPSIYLSTAVAKSHKIPLHQEVSGGDRNQMPARIAFYCVTAPKKGTGRTLVGDMEKISEEVERLMPDLWKRLQEKNLTYTARYLPEKSLCTKWKQLLNPSHSTIKKKFGTEKREEVEKKCKEEGLICKWDGDCAVVSRKGVPGIIDYLGKKLLCNQMYVDILTPKLCGGRFNYFLATTLLYPTARSRQYHVEFDDGTQFSRKDAEGILDILEKHQQGRDWKTGDLAIYDNVARAHGKTVHEGEREILVAMG